MSRTDGSMCGQESEAMLRESMREGSHPDWARQLRHDGEVVALGRVLLCAALQYTGFRALAAQLARLT